MNNGFEFKIRDDVSGIDLTTLDVQLNRESIIQRGVERTRGETQIIPVNNGYWITCLPFVPFDAFGMVALDVSCNDLADPTNIFYLILTVKILYIKGYGDLN